MNFKDLVLKRRSVRKFKDSPIAAEHVELILKAGLSAPSSKNIKPIEFLVVEDSLVLENLATCKEHGSAPIAGSKLAIIVLGNPILSDVWIEDASIASIHMQLQAEDLNIGSCWIQIRERKTINGLSSEDFIKDLLDIPMHLQILSVIAFGHKDQEKAPLDESKIEWERIHLNQY